MKWALLAKILKFYLRFTLSFTAIGYYVRKLSFGDDTANLRGKNILITGASGGIGRAVALQSNQAGAHVMAVARSADKLEMLKNESKNKDSLKIAVHDLSLQNDIRNLIESCAAGGEKIDVLINNVGVLLDKAEPTAEGFEKSFATNLLNHYLLTRELLDRNLLADDAVIINVSSGGMYNAPLMPEALNNVSKRFNGDMIYALHKRAQVALTHYWQDKYADSAMHFYVMHPGWVDTQGVKDSLPNFRKILHLILRDADMGADTIIWLAGNRPDQKGEAIWFDRKPRKTHLDDDTLKGSKPVEELIAYLEANIIG